MKRSILLGFIGAMITILLSAAFNDLFQSWEWSTVDMRFRIRGPIQTHPKLVMIDADDASAGLFGRWPWPRKVHEHMIRFLKDQDTQTIAYDILFAHIGEPEEDTSLANSVKRAGNVVFPVAASLQEKDKEITSVELPAGVGGIVDASTLDIFAVDESILPEKRFFSSAKSLGHIASNRDSDGTIRRVPLLVRFGDRLLPSLAFQTVLDFLGVPFETIKISNRYILVKKSEPISRKVIADILIPIDSKGQMLINYAGTWENTFKHASFKDVLESGNNVLGEDLTGKIVLVSNTLSGNDIKPIPFEADYPGSGIHANIINTILTRQFLKESHKSTNHSFVLILGIMAAGFMNLRHYWIQGGGLIGLIVLFGAINYIFFAAGLVLPFFTPVISIIFTGLIVALYQANFEKKFSNILLEEKRRTESNLESISNSLVRKEQELGNIQNLLNSMNHGIEQGRISGKTQEEKITDLQNKLQSVIEDKEKLVSERNALEDLVLDLRVHVSFNDQHADSEFRDLQDECLRMGIITQNPSMLEVFQTLKQSASVPSPILITGDSGTGKELVAKAVHYMGPRKNKRFVAINVAAIPEGLVESELFGHIKGSFTGALSNKNGKFEEADGGTLFLDEIGEIRKDIQVKLLRVLQEKEVQPVGGKTFKVDVRIVAATNKNLDQEIKEARFRDDLYYRLNTIQVRLPSLKERQEDVPLLANHFINRYRNEYGKDIKGISDRAMDRLKHYPWKGNIRELENVIQRGITLTETNLVREKDLHLESPVYKTNSETFIVKKISRGGDEILLEALQENRFEIKKTAHQLNMSRNTVASRFKGICFEALLKNRLDHEKTSEEISLGHREQALVLQRIKEYHKNLIQISSGCSSEDEAVIEALKRAKNVPTQYHPAIEALIRKCFEGK